MFLNTKKGLLHFLTLLSYKVSSKKKKKKIIYYRLLEKRGTPPIITSDGQIWTPKRIFA